MDHSHSRSKIGGQPTRILTVQRVPTKKKLMMDDKESEEGYFIKKSQFIV